MWAVWKLQYTSLGWCNFFPDIILISWGLSKIAGCLLLVPVIISSPTPIWRSSHIRHWERVLSPWGVSPHTIFRLLWRFFFLFFICSCVHFFDKHYSKSQGRKEDLMKYVMMCHLVLLGEHSLPGTSKITTIHSSQKLTEEESERITKLIKGEVSQVHI